MGLHIIFFVIALLLSGPSLAYWAGASSLKTQAYFNQTADLPCQFTNPENISLGELIVFWQDQDNLVLYEFYLGNENLDNVNAKYLRRTTFDQENWTLQLHNVQIKDQGSYRCFIHRKMQGLRSLSQTTSELSVFANFSEPEIVPVSNLTRHSGINLTCSSGQGYPKPKKMYYWLTTDNSTVTHDGVMQLFQDNVTELYTISTSLSVSFPDGVNNVTVTCVLQTELKILLVSSPFHIVLKDPSPVQDYKIIIAFVFIPFFIFICVIVTCITCIKWRTNLCTKKQPRGSRSRGGETIKMEREETEERVKIHVPEQNDDEVQCVVHRPESPSGD